MFSNPEIFAAIIGAIITFILGVLATYLAQIWIERRKRIQISFSKTVEIPLKIATDELKDKLKISYQGKDIETLFFFTLRIANTGKSTIRKQTFTCLFAKNAESIDPLFPRINTDPAREVGPVIRDELIKQNNEFRYTIDVLGVGQSVTIDFLTVKNETNRFDVIFKPNDFDEVKFVEGNILGIQAIDLESNVQSLVLNMAIFFVLSNFFPIIAQIVGSYLGIPSLFITIPFLLFSLPFFVNAIRSIRPIVALLAKQLQKLDAEKYYILQTHSTVTQMDPRTQSSEFEAILSSRQRKNSD